MCLCDRMKSETCWKIISQHGGADEDVFVWRRQRCPAGHCGVRKHQSAEDRVISINSFPEWEMCQGERGTNIESESFNIKGFRKVFSWVHACGWMNILLPISLQWHCQENTVSTILSLITVAASMHIMFELIIALANLKKCLRFFFDGKSKGQDCHYFIYIYSSGVLECIILNMFLIFWPPH